MEKIFNIEKTLVCLLTPLLVLLAAGPVNALRFSHIIQEKSDVTDCKECHVEKAASIIPERAICIQCHEEIDLIETELGPTKTHTPIWVKLHGQDSQEAGSQCSSCHNLPFCADCHRGGELRPDLTKRSIGPDSVPRSHTSRFSIVHPLKATGAQLEQCYTCHSSNFCIDCHEEYRSKYPSRQLVSHQKSGGWAELAGVDNIPGHADSLASQCQDCHPGGALSASDWSQGHAREARRSLSTCQSCHPDGNECLICHSAMDGLQINPHPKNWRSIQRKFKNESPGVCEQCHFTGTF